MGDKSPKQSSVKKPAVKSIKEKRADKRGAAEESTLLAKQALKGKKG